MKFTVSHVDESDFTYDGLRAFFECRGFGIKEAAAGWFNVHVIRARPGEKTLGEWHRHDLDFQMV